VIAGAIDCDVHPQVPKFEALFPHLDPYWRDSFIERGIEGFDTSTYPPKAPISARPEWRGNYGGPAADLPQLATQIFGRWQARYAICNCLYGVELPFSEDMGRALARAVNDWISK
jgi:uncharacterized protein